ncbi:MAG: hypothetical protein WBZ29_09570, partial [Methanocella sp.]
VLVGAMLVAMASPAFAYSEQTVGDVSTQVNNGLSLVKNSGSSSTYDFTLWDYANWYNTLKNNDNLNTIYVGVKGTYHYNGGSGGIEYTFGQIGYGQTWSGDSYKSRIAISSTPTSSGCSLDKLHYYNNAPSTLFSADHKIGVIDTIT